MTWYGHSQLESDLTTFENTPGNRRKIDITLCFRLHETYQLVSVLTDHQMINYTIDLSNRPMVVSETYMYKKMPYSIKDIDWRVFGTTLMIDLGEIC